jgi:hypothetical protein
MVVRMGVLDRFRPHAAETWNPPTFGACVCADHVDKLLTERITLADRSGDWIGAAELVTTGALTVLPAPNDLYVDVPATAERRGPFHWRVLPEGSLDRFCLDNAPVQLDDMLFLQPGIESVLWVEDRTILAVAAPKMCIRGIQGAMVRALMNPRLRTPSSST